MPAFATSTARPRIAGVLLAALALGSMLRRPLVRVAHLLARTSPRR